MTSPLRIWPWEVEPQKLWSLLEMVDFPVNIYLINYSALLHQEASQRRYADAGLGSEPIDDGSRQHLALLSEAGAVSCSALGLSDAGTLLREFHSLLKRGAPCTHERALTTIEQIASLMYSSFAEQRFLYVPPDRKQYFEHENLFRLGRPHPFPSAKADIKAAGTCLALGLETASVFHLMRVAEIGLRSLAKHLRVSLRDHRRRTPVEWAQWEKVLSGVRAAIDRKYPQSNKPKPVQSAHREFYHGVWSEFQGFKDVYRNHVMHVRRTYGFHDAAGALEHVGGFLRRLSTRVHE